MRDMRGQELAVGHVLAWADIEEEQPVLRTGLVERWDDETGTIWTTNPNGETHVSRACTVETRDEH